MADDSTTGSHDAVLWKMSSLGVILRHLRTNQADNMKIQANTKWFEDMQKIEDVSRTQDHDYSYNPVLWAVHEITANLFITNINFLNGASISIKNSNFFYKESWLTEILWLGSSDAVGQWTLLSLTGQTVRCWHASFSTQYKVCHSMFFTFSL